MTIHINMLGPQHRLGDITVPLDYGFDWCSSNPTLLSTQWESVNVIGGVKYIPLSELHSEHANKVRLNKQYFKNEPPTPELDAEDPNQDMTRVYHPVAKQVVKKGALFLFGQQKFKGVESFKFSNESFQKEFTRVWKQNQFDSRVIDLGQSYLRDGDAIYKVVSKKIGTEIIGEEVIEGKVVTKEAETADISFIKTNAEHWSIVVHREDPSKIIMWVYQFEREDGSYVREEYFNDQMMKYEGQLVSKKKDRTSAQKLLDTALLRNVPVENLIEFKLIEIQKYPEFGRFPILRFKNNEESSLWGTTVLDGHLKEINRLNEVLTRMAYAIKNQADPLLWLSGAEAADQNTHASDAIWAFPNADAKLNVLQWEGTPESVFTFINMIESKIYDCAFIPRSSEIEKIFSSDNRMSGKGLQELKSDIIDATLARRLDFERGFEDMLDIIARITGIEVPTDESAVDIIWGPVFATGAMEKREALMIYLKNEVISREKVIELSDDFTPEMKEELKAELAVIDKEKMDKELKMKAAQQTQAPRQPEPSGGPRRPSRRR